ATIYGIVKQNGGYIEVESQPGKGATFRIFFSRITEEKPATEKLESHEANKGCERILLVEDESALLEVTEEMLSHHGYNVFSTTSPAEALKKANSGESFHILVTDVIMPEMTGNDLAREIKKNNPEIKIVFMSGYTSNMISSNNTGQEGYFFVQKPFSAKQLVETIKASLEKPDKSIIKS
ncbi:MAG: response regulator, partial [Candidatus Rifleibacteriota bacterium]